MSPAATTPALLAGVYPVLCTPFDERGALDFASLDRLVDFVLGSGADGLTVGGLASEVHKLADEERRAIAERVLARVARRAPVWVGAGHQCTELAIAHALHAQERGAAGVMVMPPHVTRPSLAALAAFFHDLDAAIALPIMIQDAPLFTGLHLPVDWLLDVARACPRVVAVKVEAPPTAPKVRELARRVDVRLAIFGGLGGANLVAELEQGAAGTLPGAAFPELLVDVRRRFLAGDAAGARERHERALPLIRFVSQSVDWSHVAYKRILVARGVLPTACVRRPAARYDAADAAELDQLWRRLEAPR